MDAATALDYSIFKTLNGLSDHPVVGDAVRLLANDLGAVMMVLVALVFLVRSPARLAERRSGAVLATAAAGLALLLNQPVSHAVDRLRPYVAHPDAHLLLARSPDASFPSDHATGAFALAFGIWLYDRTVGTVLLVLAAVLSLARVAAGTHYPSDVLAGALVGVAVAGALYLLPLTRRILEALAARAGQLWDAALSGLPPRARAGRA